MRTNYIATGRMGGARRIAALLVAGAFLLPGAGQGQTLRADPNLSGKASPPSALPAAPAPESSPAPALRLTRALNQGLTWDLARDAAAEEAPPAAGAGQQSLVSLQESIGTALTRSPRVREAEAAWRAAVLAAGQAGSARYPSIDLVSGARVTRAGRDGQDPSPQSSGVTLSYSLYDGGKVSGDLEERGLQARAAYQRLGLARQEVALKAAQSHLQVAKYQDMLAVAEENIDAHQRIVGHMLEIAAIDRGRRIDVTLAQARLEQARTGRNTLQGRLREARQTYIRLAGREPGRLAGESLPLPPAEASEEALTRVIQAHPAFLALEAEAEAQRTAARTVRSAYHPQVSLEAAVSNEKDDFNRRISPTAGIVLRWNIFRGFGDAAAEKAAEARSLSATERLYETGMDLREQVLQVREEIGNLEERTGLLGARGAETDRIRGAYLEQFRVGRRSLLDLLNAEAEYFEARSNSVATRYDLMIAKARLRHARAELAAPLAAEPSEQ